MSPKRTGMHFLFCFVDLALIAPNIRWIRRFSAAAQHLIMVHFNLSPLPYAYCRNQAICAACMSAYRNGILYFSCFRQMGKQ